MKINLCAEIAESSSHKNTKEVKSYELRTKSDGTATIGAFCLNCDLCDFNDLYDSDCRNDYTGMSIEGSRTIVVDSTSPERPERATSIAQWQRPVNTRRTRDNQNHNNHTTHKISVAFFLCLILYLCGWTGVSNMSAQDTEFWFVAPDLDYWKSNNLLDRPVYFVITAGDMPATVTMTMPALRGNTPLRTVHVGANQSQQLFFGNVTATAIAQMDTIENTILTAGVTGVKYNRGIRFTSDNPVFIYYAVTSGNSKALFTMKGKRALGNFFYIPGQQAKPTGNDYPDAYPQFHVVATEDNTAIDITPTTAWYGGISGVSQPANIPVSIMLNKGETFAVRTYTRNLSPRLVGSTVSVTSLNTPVAITVADDLLETSTESSSGVTYPGGGDATGDQIVPVANVGRQYIVIRGFTGPNQGDFIYIMATQPNTDVTVTPASGAPATVTLTNAGDYHQYHLSDVNIHTAFIDADKPVYVWQQSGVNGELDAVLIPSMQSIAGRDFSFYKEASGWHRAFIVTRSGNESSFLVNGSSTIITAADFYDITGITGWKYARKDLTTSILNGVAGTVRITNTSGTFSLGYFFTGSTNLSGNSCSFGYLSAYGDFSFPSDTVYKCAGSAYTLDGGYALSYLWTLPDGSTASTATLNASLQGLYKLTADQDPIIVKDSVWVLDRFDNVSIVSSGGNDVGAGTYTYSMDLHGQPATNVSYVWKVDGVQVSTGATYSVTWTNADEHLITVEVSDASLGCSKTIRLVHHKFPDNVSDADCFIDPPAMTWGITQDWRSTETNISDHVVPLVGDMNGDSIPEIVVFTTAGRSSNVFGLTDRPTLKTIAIYDAITHTQVRTITLSSTVSEHELDTYGMINTPDNGTLIIVPTMDFRLHAYNYAGTEVWTSDSVYGAVPGDHNAAIGFADFNHDGIPEAYINNRVFNANTGKMLAKAIGGSNRGASYACISRQTQWKHSASTAAGILGTGDLQLILGNEIYELNITNVNGFSGNTLTMVKTINPPAGTVADGHTQVADFNRDGFLDVFISNSSNYASGTVYGYVWDVHNNAISAPFTIPEGIYSGKSIPLVADFDNDSIPDVLIQTQQQSDNKGVFHAFKYNPSSKSFTAMWSFLPDEDSFSTGATLFDFNLDGTKEIVLQDQSRLRIVNANDGASHTELSFGAGTVMQFPIVADPYGKNGDRSARIISVGAYQQTGSGLYQGSLNVLKASSGNWTSARPVWNQIMYNSVNVNDNVSATRYPINPATFFSGKDGILNTSDDVQPFNAFLKQAEILSFNGATFWLAPDAKFSNAPAFNYYSNGDSLVISTKLTNTGDAALNATFYVSAYKNTVAATNRMATDSSMVALDADAKDTVKVKVIIRKISTHTPLNKVILRINDRGSAAYIQQECDYDNNVFEFNPARLPRAANDTVAMLTGTTVTVGVKFNDALPVCSPAVPIVAVNPSQGVAAIVNDSIRYTPAAGFYGVDSLVYRLTCNSNDTTYNTDAKVYIIVNKPTADRYIACKGEKTTAGFEAITNVTYFWYKTETGGAPDGSAMDTRSCEAPGVWWVEARYKGKSVRPRLKVTIEEYPELDLSGFSIGNEQKVCHGNVPAQLKATGSPSGGDGAYDYQWQQSSDGVNGWTDVKDSTNTTLTPPALTSGTYYRLKVASCTTDSSNVVKITVRSSSLYNYPDLRVSVCPDAGASINLSKYIDTLDVSSLSWESVAPHIPISSAIAGPVSTGTILADDLNAYTRVYTLAYTVSNPCTSNVRRIVYLETLKNGKVRPLRDSTVICHKYAEAIQVNQIFGIDARGTWSFAAYESDGVTPVNIDAYVAESQSPTYNGAVIMNGKAIYENTAARKIMVTYTPSAGSCVAGRSFTTKIVLTDV